LGVLDWAKHLKDDLLNSLGAVGDAIVPGDQSQWHQNGQPPPPTPQQQAQGAAVGSQFGYGNAPTGAQRAIAAAQAKPTAPEVPPIDIAEIFADLVANVANPTKAIGEGVLHHLVPGTAPKQIDPNQPITTGGNAIGGAGATMAQGIAATAPRLAVQGADVLDPNNTHTFQAPAGSLPATLFGPDKQTSYTNQGDQFSQFLKDNNLAHGNAANALAIPTAGVLAGLDLFTGGKGKQITEQLAKAGTEDAVRKVLTGALGSNIEKVGAEDIQGLVKATKPAEVTKILDRLTSRPISNPQPELHDLIDEARRSTDAGDFEAQVHQMIQDGTLTDQEITALKAAGYDPETHTAHVPEVKKAVKGYRGKTNMLYSPPRDEEQLTTRGRTNIRQFYKDVMREPTSTAQQTLAEAAPGTPKSTTLYHGTADDFSAFDPAKQQTGNLGRGVYLTDNELVARYHSHAADRLKAHDAPDAQGVPRDASVKNVLKVALGPDVKIKQLDHMPTPEEVSAAKSAGFDGVRYPDTLYGKAEDWDRAAVGGDNPGRANTTLIFNPEKAKIMQSEATPTLAPEPPRIEPPVTPSPKISTYLKEQVKAQREAAKGTPLYKRLAGDLRTKLVDKTTPLNDLLAAAEKVANAKIGALDDPRIQIDRVLRADQPATMFVKDNGLEDVIRQAPNLDELNQYLIAKHAPEWEANGLKTGRDTAKDAELVKTLAPTYEPLAQKVYDYSQKLLDLTAKSLDEGGYGMISKDMAAELKQKYPKYVPFDRIFGGDEAHFEGTGGKGIANLERQTVVRRAKGSEREIQNPLESLLVKTSQTFRQGEVNRDAYMMAKLAEADFGGLGEVVKEVHPPIVPLAATTHKAEIDPAFFSKLVGFAKMLGLKGFKTKGLPGERLAYYQPGTQEVVRHFGTSRETTAHEIGHFLDDKFSLKQRFYARGESKDVGRELIDHMRKIGQSANRTSSTAERFAHAFEWWMVHRDLAKKDIPLFTKRIEQIIKETPELKPLLGIHPTSGAGVETMEQTIFGPSPFGPREPHFTFIYDGERKYYTAPQDVIRVMNNLAPSEFGLLAKIGAVPARALRLGATGANLPFTTSNLVRDQITGFVNSEKGLRTSPLNPWNFGIALFNALGHGEEYKQMMRDAAGGTSFDMLREKAPLTVARIRSSRSVGGRLAYTARHLSELVRAVEDIVARSEELTRIQQYRGTRVALQGGGVASDEARVRAADAARTNTTNFARFGEWGQVLNMVIPYINAPIQGTRILYTRTKARPAATGFKIAAVGLAPMAAITAWNLSDPKRKEAYDDIRKHSEYELQNNFVIIPPNPTQDDRHRWNVIKIPLSQELSALLQPTRRLMEYASGHEAVDWGQIAADVLQATTTIDAHNGGKGLLSSYTPAIIKPGVEAATNTNLFTGQKVVPDELKNYPAAQQYSQFTSETAKKIGAALNLSPLQIDNFISTATAGTGRQLVNVTDRLLGAKQPGGQDIVDNTVSRFAKARGTSDGSRYFEERGQAMKDAGLSADEANAYTSVLHPDTRNPQTGEKLPADSSPFAQSAKAEVYLRYPKLFALDQALAQKHPDELHDPLLNLEPKQAQAELLIRIYNKVAPGELGKDKALLKQQLPPDFQQQLDAYYAGLDQKLGKQATATTGPQFPDKTPQLQALMDQYNALGTNTRAKANFKAAHPELQAYYDQTDAAYNSKRSAIGLPSLDQVSPYPTKTAGTGTKKGRATGKGSRGGKVTIRKGSRVKVKLASATKVKITKPKKPKLARVKLPKTTA
jgi:hypothetical protein